MTRREELVALADMPKRICVSNGYPYTWDKLGVYANPTTEYVRADIADHAQASAAPPEREAKLREPALTRTQFVVQMILCYARIFPEITTTGAMARAAETFRSFLSDEKIEFGDARYAWDAAGAANIVYGYEGIDLPKALSSRDDGEAKSSDGGDFQSRVQPWMMACFGPEISADKIERNHRFLEEALELVQACGCTQAEAHQLVDYVYGRDQGEINQEVGGVMVTLAALCLANGFDMHAAGETELARIWTKVEEIRAKQAAKPKHSPLPGPSDPSSARCSTNSRSGGRSERPHLDRQRDLPAVRSAIHPRGARSNRRPDMTKRDELIALGGVGAKVRELEWNEYTDERGDPDRWDAETLAGTFYGIALLVDGFSIEYDYTAVAKGLDDLEAAKAAAQADYEQRILSALEAPAAGDGEPAFPTWGAEDEAYELGKRDGYESAIQDLDIATGGDGEFKGSTIPGGTVDVPAMKARIVGRTTTAPPSEPSSTRSEVSVEELADFLDHLDVLRIAGSANDDEAELARALLDKYSIRSAMMTEGE